MQTKLEIVNKNSTLSNNLDSNLDLSYTLLEVHDCNSHYHPVFPGHLTYVSPYIRVSQRQSQAACLATKNTIVK